MNQVHAGPYFHIRRLSYGRWLSVLCLTLVSGLYALFAGPAASASSWTSARNATPPGKEIHSFDLAVGRNGYAVMAWVSPTVPARKNPYRGLVYVRVKAPGATAFGRKRFVGVISSDSVSVEIGGRGLTLLSWSGRDGRIRVMDRGPRTAWSAPQVIRGASARYARIDVGSDGTAAAVNLRTEGGGDPKARVIAAVRDPNTGAFGNWMHVSNDPNLVGFHTAAVAGKNGQATVVWSGSCGIRGADYRSSWVDLSGSSHSDPQIIENSGCVAWNTDLQVDRKGNQYLRLGLLDGVQLSIRKPGKLFPAATDINPEGTVVDGGNLAVSKNGHMTLMWSRTGKESGVTDAYQYVTSRFGSPLSRVQSITNIRTDKTRRRDLLADIAPLPNGSIAMLWLEGWEEKGGYFRMRTGQKAWRPGEPFVAPEYPSAVPRMATVFPEAMETGPDGSAIAWWGMEDQRTLDDVGFRWTELRPKSKG